MREGSGNAMSSPGGARSGSDEVLHGGHGEGEDETGNLALGAGGSGPYR
jgi:hypothetical protein